MMSDFPKFMDQFIDYPNWKQSQKDHAVEVVLRGYMSDYGVITNTDEFLEVIKGDIEYDIAYFLEQEQYEICTLLRDLNEHL
jgi:hypothetical protein